MLRGYSLYRHKSSRAESVLGRAIAGARAMHDSETETDGWLYLGTSRADLDAADSAYLQAEELAQRHRFEYQQAAALMSRGYIQLVRERYADAIPFLESAHEIAARANAGSILTLASGNLATCYEGLGNLDEALTLLENTIVEHKRFGFATLLSEDYSELGSSTCARGIRPRRFATSIWHWMR